MKPKRSHPGKRSHREETCSRQPELFANGDPTSSSEPAGQQIPTRILNSNPTLDHTIREILEQEFAQQNHSSLPEPTSTNQLPEEDWLPARMLNEFVYCPRLFFYEYVDGIFVHNADTERGKDVHTQVDKGSGALPAPKEDSSEDSPNENIHSRSVQLGSVRFAITAKLDLVESGGQDGEVCPVDYKAGAPRENEEGREIWPADRMQLGLQMLILRENNYRCQRGFIYYRETKQRVPLEWTEDLETWLIQQIDSARSLMRNRIRPEPLVDSAKCPRCSLVSVCLPDETRFLQSQDNETIEEDTPTPRGSAGGPETACPRRLIAARDDKRALYLNSQGIRVGLRDQVLEIKEKDSLLQQIRLSDVHHVALFGNVQVSTQAIQQFCRQEIPLTYFSMGGWFYGITRGHSLSNILLRRSQFRAAENPRICLELARRFIAGKIRNARKMLMRNSMVLPTSAIQRLKVAATDALEASSLESLLGIEGAAAAVYFAEFDGMIKVDEEDPPSLEAQSPGPTFAFNFQGRNRRPPTDPVNALLSLAYSLLAKDCTIALLSAGFDPWQGFYHQIRPGRPALALDLMEEFRPLIAESATLTAINTKMVTPADFVRAGEAVNLSAAGRKKFFHAYEQRMNHLIIHPVFEYKVSYRRALELQARLLGRVLEKEVSHYTPFLTR